MIRSLCAALLMALLVSRSAAAPTTASPEADNDDSPGVSASAAGEDSSVGGVRSSMSIPALGNNGRLDCENLVIESSTGRLHATGSVIIRSDEFNIDCQDLVFDQENNSMTATGERVQLELQNMTAVCSNLQYDTESGEMILERDDDGDNQPYIIQRGEESTFNAFADRIIISKDEGGESVATFNGNVQMRTTPNNPEPQAAAPTFVAPTIAIEIPGLGNQGQLSSTNLIYTGATGVLTADGGVRITSPNLDLNCQDLRYDEKQKRLLATGDEVTIRRDDVSALCTQLTYLTDIGRILLDRRNDNEPQPELWQEREDGIFHAKADQITMTEATDGRTRVDWTRNVILETVPYPETAASPEMQGPAAPVRIRSIDDLPNAQTDPYA